jgi:beta-lactamase regulating signal transducer with metallopeptidase domain
MQDLLYLVGWNQLVALAMAAAVWLFSQARFLRRRPAVLHGLWLLVLLKLVTPSIALPLPAKLLSSQKSESAASADAALPSNQFAFGLAVPSGRSAAETVPVRSVDAACCAPSVPIVAEAGSAIAVDSSTAIVGDAQSAFARGTGFALLGTSLFVTFILWTTAARQVVQTRRVTRRSGVVSGRVAEQLSDVSHRFRMRSPATLHVVDAPIAPMLWAWPGNAVIVLPRKLLDSLDDDAIRSILAHELAHLKRRDHWTNLVALAIATLFWWNPVVWLVRWRLSAASEASCDALALERLGGSRRSYAETLLNVVDSLAFATVRRSAFGMPFGEARSLKQRFDMIADRGVKPGTTRGGWILLAVGLACSTVGSAWAAEAFRTNDAAAPTTASPDATSLPLMCCPSSVSASE